MEPVPQHPHDEDSEGLEYISPDCPPEIAEAARSFHCPVCAGETGKRLKDYFDPPLAPPDPDNLSAEEQVRAVEALRARLAEKRFILEGCRHTTPADLLKTLAGTLEDEVFDPGEHGHWHITAGDDCEECLAEYDMEDALFDGTGRVVKEIARVRETLVQFQEFLTETGERIAADPDDPRDGIVVLPGCDRLLVLAPCILDRLQADIDQGRVRIPFGTDQPEMMQRLQGLEALERGLKAALVWHERDDLEWPLRLVRAAEEALKEIATQEHDGAGGRFFRDLARVAPDVSILRCILEGFEGNRRPRAEPPVAGESVSPEAWREHYAEAFRLEEPIIRIVDAEGLSEESLAKGLHIMVVEREERERRNADLLDQYRLMVARDAALDPASPEEFLDRAEIPEPPEEDDGEVEVRSINLIWEEEEPRSPWAESLPELANWEKSSRGGGEDEETGSARTEPGCRIVDPFAERLYSRLTEAAVALARTQGAEKFPRRSAFDHYVIILMLQVQLRVRAGITGGESEESLASRWGAGLFAVQCLGRIAEAILSLAPAALHDLAGETKSVQRQLRENLAAEFD